jgi:hypothetical protein
MEKDEALTEIYPGCTTLTARILAQPAELRFDLVLPRRWRPAGTGPIRDPQ